MSVIYDPGKTRDSSYPVWWLCDPLRDCSISQLCIPFTLNAHELDQLDNIIERKKPIQKGQTLFKAGDELKSLYAIRSGTIKSYTITEQGDEQITGFHLAGDLVGFDAIGGLKHPSFAQALETSMVCEIPFETLDDLSGKMPNLRQQIMRLMSGEIKGDRDMILLLSKKNAEERPAAFVYNLSRRFAERGFAARVPVDHDPRRHRQLPRSDGGNHQPPAGPLPEKRNPQRERQIHHHRKRRRPVGAGRYATHQRDRQRLIPLPDQHFTEIVDPARFCCCSVFQCWVTL